MSRNLMPMLIGFCLVFLAFNISLWSHCQMPCGIYNDQMVYDQINEFEMTMFKCVKALEHNKFETLEERNQFIRWVMTKDKECDQASHTLCYFFLQQKIQPIDDNIELVKSLHKLLFLIVAIKQNVDIKMVKEFGKEWAHFKELFHPELECKAPQKKTGASPTLK